MSQFNAIGEYGLNDVLTKRLTTPGGSNAPSVAPEIFPVLALESDRPEWSWLKGEILAARYGTVAAVAGQFSAMQYYLPTNARTVAVVKNIRTHNNTAIVIARLVGISGGLAGWTGRTTATCDTRAGGQNTAVICEDIQNIASPSQFPTMTILNATNQEYEQPIVIAPGGSLGIIGAAVNTALQVSITWYERPAQPGELA